MVDTTIIINKGSDYATNAIAFDKKACESSQHPSLFLKSKGFYVQAIECYMTALKFEKNEKIRNALKSKISSYLDRVEIFDEWLKKYNESNERFQTKTKRKTTEEDAKTQIQMSQSTLDEIERDLFLLECQSPMNSSSSTIHTRLSSACRYYMNICINYILKANNLFQYGTESFNIQLFENANDFYKLAINYCSKIVTSNGGIDNELMECMKLISRKCKARIDLATSEWLMSSYEELGVNPNESDTRKDMSKIENASPEIGGSSTSTKELSKSEKLISEGDKYVRAAIISDLQINFTLDSQSITLDKFEDARKNYLEANEKYMVALKHEEEVNIQQELYEKIRNVLNRIERIQSSKSLFDFNSHPVAVSQKEVEKIYEIPPPPEEVVGGRYINANTTSSDEVLDKRLERLMNSTYENIEGESSSANEYLSQLSLANSALDLLNAQ